MAARDRASEVFADGPLRLPLDHVGGCGDDGSGGALLTVRMGCESRCCSGGSTVMAQCDGAIASILVNGKRW